MTFETILGLLPTLIPTGLMLLLLRSQMEISKGFAVYRERMVKLEEKIERSSKRGHTHANILQEHTLRIDRLENSREPSPRSR